MKPTHWIFRALCVCVRASVCLIIFAGAQRLRDGTVEKSNVVFCLRYCWQMELYRAIANVQQYTCNRTCIAHSYKHSYIHTFRIILVIRAFVHSHMYLHTYIHTDRQTDIHTYQHMPRGAVMAPLREGVSKWRSFISKVFLNLFGVIWDIHFIFVIWGHGSNAFEFYFWHSKNGACQTCHLRVGWMCRGCQNATPLG